MARTIRVSLLKAFVKSTAKVQDLTASGLCFTWWNESRNSSYPGRFWSSAISHSTVWFVFCCFAAFLVGSFFARANDACRAGPRVLLNGFPGDKGRSNEFMVV